MRRKNWELKGIFWIITLLFVGFLAAPILLLLGKSLVGEGGFTWEFYASVVTREGFLTALGNSFAVAAASAVTATVIAFLMAYAVHYTRIAQVGQAAHHRHRDPAHVPAHHHLWLCHHLLLRQTGAAHPPAGAAVL